MRRHWIAGAAAGILLGAHAFAATIRVAAAISLKDALEDAQGAFEKASGDTLEFTFGSSGALEAQIKSGAETDVFISAAAKQMDALAAAKMIDPATRRDVARNELVLVVPPDSKLSIAAFGDLAKRDVKKVALGQPDIVPAGQYAAEVIKKLGLTDALADKTVYGANVRQVLSYVERGEVDAGVVYATDAKESGDKVKVAATAAAGDHPPIVYPAAIISASKKKEEGKKFLDFLAGEKGTKALTDRGFTLPAAATQAAK